MTKASLEKGLLKVYHRAKGSHSIAGLTSVLLSSVWCWERYQLTGLEKQTELLATTDFILDHGGHLTICLCL